MECSEDDLLIERQTNCISEGFETEFVSCVLSLINPIPVPIIRDAVSLYLLLGYYR